MILGFQYGTKYIEFNAEFKKRKTIKISISPPNIVNVSAPAGISHKRLVEIVETKAKWIENKLESVNKYQFIETERKFEEGEGFMYLGKTYPLHILYDDNVRKPHVELYYGKFNMTVCENDNIKIKNEMEQWYRLKAYEYIICRIKYYQKFFDKKPRKVKVKEQKRIWGSCTYRDDLYFNWRCIMAEADSVDYIIVHEMCHMKYKNHSKEYWNFVSSILPDYKVRKEWLKINGSKMDL